MGRRPKKGKPSTLRLSPPTHTSVLKPLPKPVFKPRVTSVPAPSTQLLPVPSGSRSSSYFTPAPTQLAGPVTTKQNATLAPSISVTSAPGNHVRGLSEATEGQVRAMQGRLASKESGSDGEPGSGQAGNPPGRGSELFSQSRHIDVSIPAFRPASTVRDPMPDSLPFDTGEVSTVDTGPNLTPEQQACVQVILEGKSVFITGSAGTGKSILVRDIVKQLRARSTHALQVAITASTGLAACNIGGLTIQSWAGVGLATESAKELRWKITRNKDALERWHRVSTLVIDEISMVSGELFDKLADVAQQLRGNTLPFGGIQLVICGDFFQLPPVAKDSTPTFAFEAAAWNAAVPFHCILTHVFRQKERRFAELLNRVREGTLSTADENTLRKLQRPPPDRAGTDPTQLFSKRAHVEQANNTRLFSLNRRPIVIYPSWDEGPEFSRLADLIAPDAIGLVKGAQVMYLRNVDHSLVNGRVGVVIRFANSSTPQDGVQMRDPNPHECGRILPIVRFPDERAPCGYRDVMVYPVEWTIHGPTGQCVATRVQLPLVLAWALSIHKSQGMGLPAVKLDLSNVFAPGQAYVGLSRVTDINSIELVGFNRTKIHAHPKVVAWYRGLAQGG